MSHSAAMRLARASSFFFSPLLKRQFSSSTALPGSTSTPSSQSRTSGTSAPSRPDRCRATGASDSVSLHSPSFGRPKCEVSITRAPAPSAWRMPGSAARMRVSSVILPSFAGTLKSTRISTRLPRRSRSVIFRNVMSFSLRAHLKMRGYIPSCSPRSGAILVILKWPLNDAGPAMTWAWSQHNLFRVHERNRRIEHAIAESPLVVVPGGRLHQRAVRHLGERGVENAGMRIVVEVHRHQRFRVVDKDALQAAFGRVFHHLVYLIGRGREVGDEGEIDGGYVDGGHAHGVALQLAVQRRQHQAPRCRRAGLGRDHG